MAEPTNETTVRREMAGCDGGCSPEPRRAMSPWRAVPGPVGRSGARTARLVADGQPDRYLKEQASAAGDGVRAEADRLRWLATTPLAGRVPRIVSYETGPPLDRLVTSAVSGRPGIGCPLDPLELAGRFGAALRQVHQALDRSRCPFDARL